MAVVCVVTVLGGFAAAAVLRRAGQDDPWQRFGFRLDTLGSSLRESLRLIATLFLGPLVVLWYEVYLTARVFVEKTGQSYWQALWKYVRSCTYDRWAMDGWPTMRNLVTGPLTEEIVFRGYMLPLLLVSGVDPTTASLAAPGFFGAAHLHHAVELLRMQYPPSSVVVSTLFQMAYTWVFGIIAAFMFVCTNNIAGPIAAHVFCNWMGLPDLSFLSAPDEKAPKEDVLVHEKRWLFLAVYVVGVVGFVYGMQDMTSASLSPATS
jgi:prenyl protein peptidase